MQKTTPPGRWIAEVWQIYLEKTNGYLPKVPRAKFLGSPVLFCFISKCKFVSFKNQRAIFQWLLACLNFTLESEDLFYWYKQKKRFLWTMEAAKSAENHGDEWGMHWCIHQFKPKTHLQNLLAAEALILKISFHKLFPKWSRRHSVLNLMESQCRLRQQL